MAEITAHAGWVTGMDLASQSGLLITSSEDGYVRVRFNFYWIFKTIYLLLKTVRELDTIHGTTA